MPARVGVLHNGRIVQEGSPDEVFRKPVNKFVARYSGIRNFFKVGFLKEEKKWRAISSNKLSISISENNLSG
ncbi:MAG: hypothetical protein MZV63_45940 [Marinilabiliales bacterium]|nr:hypothetical protein [Marinilabiliales bacterium]